MSWPLCALTKWQAVLPNYIFCTHAWLHSFCVSVMGVCKYDCFACTPVEGAQQPTRFLLRSHVSTNIFLLWESWRNMEYFSTPDVPAAGAADATAEVSAAGLSISATAGLAIPTTGLSIPTATTLPTEDVSGADETKEFEHSGAVRELLLATNQCYSSICNRLVANGTIQTDSKKDFIFVFC